MISEYTNFILFHFPNLKLERSFNVGFFNLLISVFFIYHFCFI